MCIVTIVLLVGTNVMWIVYENQFVDEEVTTIEAEQDGADTNIVGGGDIVNVAEGKDN